MATHDSGSNGPMEFNSERTPEWIPLMDYAMKTGVSLSTLRRYIKANKIQYKVEHGRYLLLDDGGETQRAGSAAASGAVSAVQAYDGDPLALITRELQQAQEEIAELKTLIALYEENMARSRLDA